MPKCFPTYQNPIPFLYTSNGKSLFFCDFRQNDAQYQCVKAMHKPKKLVEMLGLDAPFAGLPFLSPKGLRNCQFEAITALEKSFRAGQRRALMVLATGAGKTFAACLAAYRMLAYASMRRVLFLVDRNNLGKQAEAAFGTFRLTENGDAFSLIYAVNRLTSAHIPADSSVVISTIQRLFSLLKGEEMPDNDDDDMANYVAHSEMMVPEHPSLPRDFFDMIVIDECHRSIYGNWRNVLEYFDSARLVGLTATPVPETLAFFNQNVVVNYTLEQSILDGVNVDHRVYRIKTQVTEQGGAILEGDHMRVETRYTGQVEEVQAKTNESYTAQELNRSVINPSQIKLILQTYKDAVYRDMFCDPQREANFDYLPKTLIFAINDAHATNIVRIAKEVFGRTDDHFVQKITYSAGDSDALIRQFRNDADFRIAVTCTLVATGTDVRPIEVVMFMRDVTSETLYTQMKGRGVRTIGDDQLRNVTPNAVSKDCFFLVDAVGVTEHEHTIPAPYEPNPEPISLRLLLERITHGYLLDHYLKLLAGKLARIYNKADAAQRNQFAALAHAGMNEISQAVYEALGSATLPPFESVNQPNEARKALVAPLASHADARQYLLILAAGFVKTLIPGEDTLLFTGFTAEESRSTTEAFEAYCRDHRDQIEALRIIYNQSGQPITYAMLRDLEDKLQQANNRFTAQQLWNSYAIVAPEQVRRATKQDELKAITNLIQLVRYAFHQTERLETLVSTANQYFNLWLGQNQRALTPAQREIMAKIVDYVAYNGACSVKDITKDSRERGVKLIRAFGNDINQANEALQSMFSFVVFRKTA